MTDVEDTLKFMETLIVSQGPDTGKTLKLMDWQKDFIRGIYAPTTSTAALSVPRGNGKTTLISAIAAAAFIGPNATPGSEIVLVAGSFQQAKIAFSHLRAFIEPYMYSGSKDSSGRDWRCVDNNSGAEIIFRPERKAIKVKAANPKGAHGLAPTMVICDEPAQWPPNFSDAMVSALITAMGKQGNELMVAIGTRPADPDHWFQHWLDGEADVAVSYHAKEDTDYMSDETLYAVNPSTPLMPALVNAIKKDRDRARESDEALAYYKSLRLNMGTRDIKTESIVSIEDWQRCETENLPDRDGPCVWGIDLGGAAAMSAVAAYWPRANRLEVFAAFPDHISLAERGSRDKVGDRYVQMQKRGELVALPGRVVQVPDLLMVALAKFGPPDVVCADRWKQAELLDGLDRSNVPYAPFSARGEGYKDGGEDSRLFVTAVQTGKVKLAPSLLMRSAISGSTMISDPAGNRKLARAGDGSTRKAAHRDDALAAAMKAVSEACRNIALQEAASSVEYMPKVFAYA